MLLSEIFEHLTYGELSTLDIGGLKKGGIQPEHYAQVISFINMGLMDLYKKFILLEKSVTVDLYENITEYHLTYEHAQSNPAPADPYITRYIADTGFNGPFTADILQIHSVYDKNFEEIPLNDLNDKNSVFTIMDNIVQVPYPGQGTYLDFIYQAAPKKIALTTDTCNTEDVLVPQQLLSALTAYVGFRAHISLPAGRNSKATEHLSRYTDMTNEILHLGTLNKPTLKNLKLEDKGFKQDHYNG